MSNPQIPQRPPQEPLDQEALWEILNGHEVGYLAEQRASTPENVEEQA